MKALDTATLGPICLAHKPLPVLPALSYTAAKAGGAAMYRRWVGMTGRIPPFAENDAAWADMFRAGYEAVRG